MGFYRERILPRLVHRFLNNRHVNAERDQCIAQARGLVLEIGFGSGLNLPFYRPGVKRLFAVDPSLLALQIAQKTFPHPAFPLQYMPFPAEVLPFEDSMIDTVVVTFSLCTVVDPVIVLQEARRVLKPGGKFLFLEHGASQDPFILRWQNRLTPIHSCLSGGCQLNRKIDELVTQNGFQIQEIEKQYLKGPRVATYIYRGVAVPDKGVAFVAA